MNKTFMFLGMLSIGIAYAQQGRVGINTEEPKATLHISQRKITESNKSLAQGVIFPHITTAERDNFTNVEKGTMIFNTDKQCVEIYAGNPSAWSCVCSCTEQQQQKVTVTPAGFTGSYVAGVALNGHKVKFLLKNNSLSRIDNVDFSSAVTVRNGSSNVQVSSGQNSRISLDAGASTTLEYTLTGTPVQGELTAIFDHLGLQAEQKTNIGLGAATIKDKEHYIVSLSYQGADIQGKINNNTDKLTIQIPYTNGSGSYGAVNVQATTVAGQDGGTNLLTLSIPEGNFAENGVLTATVQVGGDGEYLTKKLQPGQKEDIATFNVNMNGTQYKVKLVAIGGIPDKYFNTPMKDGKFYHKYIYVPVTLPDGTTWLSQDLGSQYSKLGDPLFNPGKTDAITSDISTFKYENHEGNRYVGRELNKSDLVSYNEKNENPCPSGYRVPDWQEYLNLNNISKNGILANFRRGTYTYAPIYTYETTNTRTVKYPCGNAGNFTVAICTREEEYTSTYYRFVDYSSDNNRFSTRDWGGVRPGTGGIRCIKE